MQTGWRLERTYLAGAGFPESRLEGLDLNWSDPLESTGHGHAALWADNGTGKTTITALRYALYLPHTRDFIRGNSDRSLAILVRSGDVCHVVEQATRVVNGELQRIVAGMVADWADGGTQDLDNPSRLNRVFYGWVTDEHGPTIDILPFRTGVGRWATRNQFVEAMRGLLPHGGALPPHPPSDHQTAWGKWLRTADVDLEQVRFQTVMNASEGGVDRVMQFPDADAFVLWLIGTTTPTSTVELIAKSIEGLRANAAARPRWQGELDLWQRILDPLLALAITHEEVTGNRRAMATAEAKAAAVVADAAVTVAGLRADVKAAEKQHKAHESRRGEAVRALRRAQAHRLRLQLRAARLRADVAEALAQDRHRALGAAERNLAAWKLVSDVLEAAATASRLAGLTERLEAAEKETAALRADERRHRHALARLHTDRRDRAAAEFAAAEQELRAANKVLDALEGELQSAVAEQATAAEQAKQAELQIAEAEQVLAGAVTAGLIDEGADPAAVDAALAGQADAGRRARAAAEQTLEQVSREFGKAQEALAAARQRATLAHNDAIEAERQLTAVTRRVNALTRDDRLQDAVGDPNVDLWRARDALVDALHQRERHAVADADAARAAAAAAARTVEAVGADGLLPAAQLAEEVARRCQDAELPAWPGWRWLADTMTPRAAAAFATVRPEIASGVVVAHSNLVDRAAEVARTVDLDVAMWIGAVMDSKAAAATHHAGDGTAGTRAHVVLPHPGNYDRTAAGEMVAAAQAALEEATRRERDAERHAEDARAMVAALSQLWADLPDDPREELATRIRTAGEREQVARSEEADAAGRLEELDTRRREQEGARDVAQQALDDAAETRRLLAPVISAAKALAGAHRESPRLRDAVREHTRRVDDLTSRKPQLAIAVTAARDRREASRRRRSDTAEELRRAGLSATTDGPVPADDEDTICARLDSVREALDQAAVDPALHQKIDDARQQLADLNARLDVAPERRSLAEQFAEGEEARHPVALAEAIHTAERQAQATRNEYAHAQATADTATGEYRKRIEDRSLDRSHPDVEGFPPAETVITPEDAERLAAQLDDLTDKLGDTQRTEERRAKDAEDKAKTWELSARLVETSVNPLRYLAEVTLTGRRATDVEDLISRIEDVTEQLRTSREALTSSERAQHAAASAVREHANSLPARKVEEAGDPRVVDLLLRLRGDKQLPAESERIAGHLEERAASLRDDLDRHEQDVRRCATMLHVQADLAIQRLRAYQNQSRLPDGLGDWSQRRFVVIDHDPVPDDEPVAVDRVARVVHALLTPGASRSGAASLLFAAARALVDAPFRVRLLKPHTDLSLDRVDVAELKNFSGGQRVTAGVLLYATMTRVRAADNSTSIGWLWLDNPFGQASADQFVRTMRLAADKLRLQLLFTAAPKDKGALSMFDRTVMLARRLRPSSREKVVVVDDGSREVVDLTLVQKDVTAVLGG